jgi:hypothetical protein
MPVIAAVFSRQSHHGHLPQVTQFGSIQDYHEDFLADAEDNGGDPAPS